MLNRLVFINSSVYAKADIQLEGIASLQLVGQNNVGKSSLVNALNFLYITEPSQMRFEGDRTLQESLKHYFPTLDESYIIFEIKKSAYTCILVKRNEANELSYYTIAHAYQEDLFLTTEGDVQTAIPFPELNKNIIFKLKGINLRELNREELYHTVYSDKKAEQPFLLLTPNKRFKRTRGKKYHNTFVEIYKHLIGSKKPSAQELTDMLIAASYTRASKLTVFVEDGESQLAGMQKQARKARNLANAKPDFEKLTAAHAIYEKHHETLGKAYYTFQQQYPIALDVLQQEVTDLDDKVKKTKDALKKLDERQATLQQDKGRCQTIAEQQNTILANLEKQLQAIAPYQSELALHALKQKVETLEAHKMALKEALHDRQGKPKTSQQLQDELTRYQRQANRLTHTIQNFSNTLIQHISPDPKVRQRLNTLLGDRILHLTKEAIRKKATEISDKLHLFDGVIDVSTITEEKPFTSVEALQEQLEEAQQSIQTTQALLDNQEALVHAETEWAKQFKVLQQAQGRPNLLEQQTQARATLAQAQQEEENHDQALQKLDQKATQQNEILERYREKRDTFYQRKQQYEDWQTNLRTNSLPVIEERQTETDLGKLHEAIQAAKKQADAQHATMRGHLHNIALVLGPRYLNDDMDQAIQALQEEFDAMEIYSKEGYKTALKGVKNTLVQPIETFLREYQEFKDYVRDFSSKLADHHISGIPKIGLEVEEVTRLINDLTEISNIQVDAPLLWEDETVSKRMKLLQTYMQKRRTYALKELFKLKLNITQHDGKPHTLDFDKQMESYGTDKVLRVFIFVMLLKSFFVPDPTNRVAIYIDEIGTIDRDNMDRLLALCAQYYILPIFASISFVGRFDKYYILVQSPSNDGRVCVDEQTTMISSHA